jgi:NAD(P)-dependent dehydrogenase (short-subunit alcohol dehydrogenase family)
MTNKQTILVTGATGSIGGAAALALVKGGARVVLLGRSLDKLKARAQRIRTELSETGIDYHDDDIDMLVVDFTDMDSVRNAAAEAMNRFQKIDGLILSVGVLMQNGPNILPNGHELMFATNVMGPFLFTQLLIERMEQSEGLILHVIAPFNEEIDWNDLESVKNHRTMTAFDRTKICNRIIAGELARRYAGRISSVAFNPTYVIDKSDPELKKRWPSGFTGFVWRMMTVLVAKPPAVAGEPIANLMLSYRDRSAINGALFKLDKRVEKSDKVMNNKVLGKRLWDELDRLTRLTTE